MRRPLKERWLVMGIIQQVCVLTLYVNEALPQPTPPPHVPCCGPRVRMPSKHNAPTCFVRGLSYGLTCVVI